MLKHNSSELQNVNAMRHYIVLRETAKLSQKSKRVVITDLQNQFPQYTRLQILGAIRFLLKRGLLIQSLSIGKQKDKTIEKMYSSWVVSEKGKTILRSLSD